MSSNEVSTFCFMDQNQFLVPAKLACLPILWQLSMTTTREQVLHVYIFHSSSYDCETGRLNNPKGRDFPPLQLMTERVDTALATASSLHRWYPLSHKTQPDGSLDKLLLAQRQGKEGQDIRVLALLPAFCSRSCGCCSEAHQTYI